MQVIGMKPNVTTYSSLINACEKEAREEEFDVFKSMQATGVEP